MLDAKKEELEAAEVADYGFQVVSLGGGRDDEPEEKQKFSVADPEKTVSWYLKTISPNELLRPEEEIAHARAVQQLLALQVDAVGFSHAAAQILPRAEYDAELLTGGSRWSDARPLRRD